MDDGAHEIQLAYDNLKEAAYTPIRALTSKPAQRTYISTILLLLTSTLLLILAAIAYLLFYHAYVPQLGFSRPIHLQFTPDAHPYGTAFLAPDLGPLQPYDVSVRLRLPRTPANVEVGNFMVDVALLGGESGGEVVVREARPASLTYRSGLVEGLGKVVRLPWYVMGWKQEMEVLEVGIMEEVEFAKGWRALPREVRVEVRSAGRLQVYGVEVRFITRFNGVRWLMYNQRNLSFVLFTGIFWVVEMTFALSAYLIFTLTLGSKPTAPALIKPELESSIKPEDESDALSDTSRTFPTFSKQPPLRYSSPKVKDEEAERSDDIEAERSEREAVQAVKEEADDENEEADDFAFDHGVGGGRSDSGLGTSMDSSAGGSDALRRRKGKR